MAASPPSSIVCRWCSSFDQVLAFLVRGQSYARVLLLLLLLLLLLHIILTLICLLVVLLNLKKGLLLL